MNELREYTVQYHTKPGVGVTYYKGSIKVFAENDGDAEERARREIHRSFRERWITDIVIDGVSRGR